jgi:hypothetical protein
MPTDAGSRSASFKQSLQKLNVAASALNQVSDRFGRSITELEDALGRLSLGIVSWVTYHSTSDDRQPWIITVEQVGYATVAIRKGLCLRVVTFDENDPENSEEIKNAWQFNNAPREMRLRAIESIPSLIEDLLRQAEQLAKRIEEKQSLADSLVEAVNEIAGTESQGDK